MIQLIGHNVPSCLETGMSTQNQSPRWLCVSVTSFQSTSIHHWYWDPYVVGANQNACGSECRIAVRLLQKPAYTAYDFTDLGVALSRSFMPWGDHNPEDRAMANKSKRGWAVAVGM